MPIMQNNRNLISPQLQDLSAVKAIEKNRRMITAVLLVPPQTADGVWDRLIENFEAKIVIFFTFIICSNLCSLHNSFDPIHPIEKL